MPRTGNPRFKAKVGKYIFSDLDSRINMTTLKPPCAAVWERPGLFTITACMRLTGRSDTNRLFSDIPVYRMLTLPAGEVNSHFVTKK